MSDKSDNIQRGSLELVLNNSRKRICDFHKQNPRDKHKTKCRCGVEITSVRHFWCKDGNDMVTKLLQERPNAFKPKKFEKRGKFRKQNNK